MAPVEPQATETGEDHSIFLLNGNVGLTLNDNSTGLTFTTAPNTEVGLILNATDRNETIFDLTRNSSPTVRLQTGGKVNIIGDNYGMTAQFGAGTGSTLRHR